MDLKETWEKYHKDIPRLSWHLRIHKAETWFRIHSLPESKRYPDSKDEESILLDRHNEIAPLVLQDSRKLHLHWSWKSNLHGIAGTKTGSYEDDGVETPLYAAEVKSWSPGHYDELIRSVAHDELPAVIFMNPKTGNIYAPYDGGADIFIEESKLRKRIQSQFAMWASQFEGGL